MNQETRNSNYRKDFFDNTDATSAKSAREVVPLLLSLIRIDSVVDVGCGVGSWLQAFAEAGVHDYLGIDGDYVGRDQLRIKTEKFLATDLAHPVNVGRKYDLALCLEVGEHLPPEGAHQLIKTLSEMSDCILFSAAIPFQPGTNHVNCQWPAYWARLFAAEGYKCFDCIRQRIWDNASVAWWFTQNTLFYCRGDGFDRLLQKEAIVNHESPSPNGLVHPAHYEATCRAAQDFQQLITVPHLPWAGRAMMKSLRASLHHRFSCKRGVESK
jgi:SAM-dependent methyltransferase